MLNRLYLLIVSVVCWAVPQYAWAEGAGGSYKGIASMYYALIAVVLIYGVYDIFGKKIMYYAAPVIAVTTYFLVPDV